MRFSPGSPASCSTLLGVERQVILDAAHRLITVAGTDPGMLSREELADAVGALAAASEHAALMAGRYMDVGDTHTVCLTKGEKSMVAMINARTHLSRHRTRQLLRAGKLQHRFPHFHAAVMAGRITTGHVDAFLRLADRANTSQVANAERDLAALAVLSTPEEFIDQLRIWEAAADPTEHLDEFIRAQARRNLSWAKDLFGNIHLAGTLEPIAGEQVVNAILNRKTRLETQRDVKGVAAAHDALVDLVLGESAKGAHIEILITNHNNPNETVTCNQTDLEPAPTNDQIHDCDPTDHAHHDRLLTLTLEVESAEHFARYRTGITPPTPPAPTYRDTGFGTITYPRTSTGTLIPPAIITQLATTGRTRTHPINPNGTLQNDQPGGRHFTTTQKRMIRLRDNHCQHPGCRTPARWCDTDHITPHNTNGPTLIRNGQLLCRFHHRWKHHRDPGPSELRATQFDNGPLVTPLE